MVSSVLSQCDSILIWSWLSKELLACQVPVFIFIVITNGDYNALVSYVNMSVYLIYLLVSAPFNDTTTCIVDGTTFKAGQRFSPKDSCYTCICAKGFDGKYEEPYCKRSGCDVQLRNQLDVKKFCAPVYIKDRLIGDKICCPTTWTCRKWK